MIGAAIGFLLPMAAVWFAMVALGLLSDIRSRAVLAAVAVGCGLGASSLVATWLLALGMTVGRTFVVVDALVWMAIGAFAWRLCRRGEPGGGRLIATVASRRLTAADWVVRGVFWVVAVAAVVVAVIIIIVVVAVVVVVVDIVITILIRSASS